MIAAQVQAARSAALNGSTVEYVLPGTVAVLLLFGVLMVASTTVAETGSDDAWALLGPTLKHLAHLAVGIVALVIVTRVPVSWWQAMSKPLLLAGLVMLGFLALPGVGLTYNGSTRWLNLGGFGFQPAEPAKLFMVVYAAGYLTRKQDSLGDFVQGVLMIGLVLAAMGLLLLRQPDLGSFVVIALTVGTMLFLAGMRLRHFLACAAAGAGALALLIWSRAYRSERVTSFLDPWADPSDTSYQLVQGLIALGRGELFGVGLGASVQKLYFLPHAENDFLLAVIGEELGFVGVCAVIVLFAILLWRGFAVSRAAEETGQPYAARLAQGISLLLGLQAMIHIGVNLGSLPTKGLTLPFMSYGGSSLVTCCVAAGILIAIERSVRFAGGRAP